MNDSLADVPIRSASIIGYPKYITAFLVTFQVSTSSNGIISNAFIIKFQNLFCAFISQCL